jgi:hypothetical protein
MPRAIENIQFKIHDRINHGFFVGCPGKETIIGIPITPARRQDTIKA